jgi:hypothetical protein
MIDDNTQLIAVIVQRQYKFLPYMS